MDGTKLSVELVEELELHTDDEEMTALKTELELDWEILEGDEAALVVVTLEVLVVDDRFELLELEVVGETTVEEDEDEADFEELRWLEELE